MQSDTLEYYKYNERATVSPSEPPNPQDLEKRLRIFYQGDTSVFDTPGLIKVIAQYILDLYRKGDMGNALILLENLGEAALSDNVEHREKSLITLSLVAEKVLDENNEDLLEAISHLLIRWLKKETEFISGYEFICLQLSTIVQKMLDLGLWYQSENLILTLQQIRKGRIKKSKVLTQVISKVQSRIADTAYLKELTTTYIDENNEKSDVAGTLLIHLGDKSAPFLVRTLANCQKKSQRLRLVELIPAAGREIVPSLVNHLQKKPPWYLARNIIIMLSEFADDSLYSHVKPYMRHSDIRVQREVIEYVKRMNSSDKTTRLLEAVNTCSDSLKPHLIRTLGPLKEKRVGSAFIGILNNYSIFDEKIKNDIVKEICRFLPYYPTARALETLDSLRSMQKSDKNLLPQTIKEIEKTYTRLLHSMNADAQDIEGFISAPEPQHTKKSSTGIDTKAVPNKEPGHTQSSHADNWIMNLANDSNVSSALKKHVQRRRNFYSKLNQSEFHALSTFLTLKTYQAGQPIVAEGDVHSFLFFIEEGKVSIEIADDASTTLFRTLELGDIIGHEVFMTGSEWDVTLTARTDTVVLLFDQEQLLHLQPAFPHLCESILEYSKANDVIQKLHNSLASNGGKPLTAKPIPFTGNVGDHLSDIDVTVFHNHGFCFSFNLPQGIDYAIFADRELIVSLLSRSGKPLQIAAHIIGLKYFKEENRKLHILARFIQECDTAEYSCKSVSL